MPRNRVAPVPRVATARVVWPPGSAVAQPASPQRPDPPPVAGLRFRAVDHVCVAGWVRHQAWAPGPP
eukprot:3204841-Lingulodinium_polyedra.AAC.1